MRKAFKTTLAGALAAAGLAAATSASADITFYQDRDFNGRTLSAQSRIPDLGRAGMNDETSSVIVTGNRWEVCEDASFRGVCVVLRPGQYASLNSMGLNNRISSARSLPNNVYVADDRYAPVPAVAQDFRRRNGQRLFEAQVVDVRAVVGAPQQRCWVEKQEVPVEHTNAIPGGIAGAVIGGILGHQIGGGSGRTLATIGGVAGGAAVGSQVGKNYGGTRTQTQDVQRCETQQAQSKPEYWDVTYTFRGQTHKAQMTSPPGQTIMVDRDGMPRA